MAQTDKVHKLRMGEKSARGKVYLKHNITKPFQSICTVGGKESEKGATRGNRSAGSEVYMGTHSGGEYTFHSSRATKHKRRFHARLPPFSHQ